MSRAVLQNSIFMFFLHVNFLRDVSHGLLVLAWGRWARHVILRGMSRAVLRFCIFMFFLHVIFLRNVSHGLRILAGGRWARHAILRGMSGAVLRFCILRFLLGKQFFEGCLLRFPSWGSGGVSARGCFLMNVSAFLLEFVVTLRLVQDVSQNLAAWPSWGPSLFCPLVREIQNQMGVPVG